MASLVEELVTVLEEEEKIYQTLISYGEKKTDILLVAVCHQIITCQLFQTCQFFQFRNICPNQDVALIKQAIELNEFDLTLFKSLRQAPETANYDKTACNTGSLLGSSGFDAMS